MKTELADVLGRKRSWRIEDVQIGSGIFKMWAVKQSSSFFGPASMLQVAARHAHSNLLRHSSVSQERSDIPYQNDISRRKKE